MKLIFIIGALLALYGANAGPLEFLEFQEPESRASVGVIAQWNTCVTGLAIKVTPGYTALCAAAIQQILSLSFWLDGQVAVMKLNINAALTAANSITLTLSSMSVPSSCKSLNATLSALNATVSQFVQNATAVNSSAGSSLQAAVQQISANISAINQQCMAACTPFNALLSLSFTVSDQFIQTLIQIVSVSADAINNSSMIFASANVDNEFIALVMNVAVSISQSVKQTYENVIVAQVQQVIQISMDSLSQVIAQVSQVVSQQTSIISATLNATITQFNATLQALLGLNQNIGDWFSNETLIGIIVGLVNGSANMSVNVTVEVSESVVEIIQEVTSTNETNDLTAELFGNITIIMQVLSSSTSINVQMCAASTIQQLIVIVAQGISCDGKCKQEHQKDFNADLSALLVNVTSDMGEQTKNLTQCVNEGGKSSHEQPETLGQCADRKTDKEFKKSKKDAHDTCGKYKKDGEKKKKVKDCKKKCKEDAEVIIVQVMQSFSMCSS